MPHVCQVVAVLFSLTCISRTASSVEPKVLPVTLLTIRVSSLCRMFNLSSSASVLTRGTFPLCLGASVHQVPYKGLRSLVNCCGMIVYAQLRSDRVWHGVRRGGTK